MTINADSLVSITEANQNFSKVARLVDTNGTAVVLKNNTPRYIILSFDKLFDTEIVSHDEATDAAKKLIKKHFFAFKELAK